jgi:hypothetical protein
VVGLKLQRTNSGASAMLADLQILRSRSEFRRCLQAFSWVVDLGFDLSIRISHYQHWTFSSADLTIKSFFLENRILLQTFNQSHE